MAKKGSFSKVYDKNGDYVDVEAARFDGSRTFQMQGDVTATQTWNGDPSTPLTLNASIGAKKVTTDKINDKAVGSAQLADDAVGLTQIDDNAMTSAATSGDDRLITSGGVRNEIDNALLNRGVDYPPMTPAQINAITDTIPTGSTVHVTEAGTITDGDIVVRAGEDLRYYRGNGEHYWYSLDGDFKLKQQAKSSPTASGSTLEFIDSISQDENGEITASKKSVQDGTTSQKGVLQLEDSHSSTSTTKAATPKNVKEAYDLANTANTGAVKNVAYDSTNKKITKTINGTTTDVVSVATLKTDMALNNVDNTSDANKPVSTAQQAALDLKLDKMGDGKDVTATFTEASTRANIGTGEKLSVIFGKIKKWFTDLGTAAFKNVPASGNASSTEVVLGSDTRLSAGASAVQDVTVDGASVFDSSTKVAAVPNASTSAKGAVQLAGSIGATVDSENNKAATEKAVRDAINDLDAEVTSTDGTNVQVKVTEADGKISAVNVTTDNTENKNNKVSSWQSTPDDTHYPSEKLVKDGLNAKADADKVLSVCDAYVSRGNVTTMGWYKLAERQFNTATTNNNSIFDIYSSTIGDKYFGTLKICLRNEGSGTEPYIKSVALYSESGWNNTYFPLKLVTRGLVGSLKLEIWVGISTSYRGVWLTEVNTTSTNGAAEKRWTYFSDTTTAGGDEPVDDATNDVKTTAIPVYVDQHNIASPTNNNLVAMDANGLVKDSGLTKSSVESAISSAGSAIQGVKVNGTTLTPDANKVVTVPLATTSADGAMSAADKTKLNGIAEGAEANVQADWNEKSSSSDAFIKNKPYYTNNAQSTYFKVCAFLKTGVDGQQSDGLEILARYYQGAVHGRLLYKAGFTLYYEKVGNIAGNSQYLKFHWKENGDYIDVYAQRTGYSILHAAPLVNQPKNNVDFTSFGTAVTSLPEGATEITPVWVANSASSSGTAPVKVDAYGALTPVPMDSTPTASSTNLMTSGDIKTALDGKQDSLPTSGTPSNTYAINISGKASTSTSLVKASGSSAGTSRYAKLFTLQSPYNDNMATGVVIAFTARDSNNNNKSGFIRFRSVNNVETGYVTILNSGNVGNQATTRFGFVKVSTGVYEIWAYLSIYSRISAQVIAYDDISYTAHSATYETTAPEGLTLFTNGLNVTKADNQSAVGSTSIPTYVDSDGEIKACTDDFARDSEVVTSVQKETVSNVTKLTYTKNGSKTDIVEFMTTAEAQLLWTNAKNAVAAS